MNDLLDHLSGYVGRICASIALDAGPDATQEALVAVFRALRDPAALHGWESTDPNFDAKLDRIEEVTTRFPDRCFAFDQFGPLSIRPHHGTSWSLRSRPDRLLARPSSPGQGSITRACCGPEWAA
jgi:hypothetical protein